MLYQINMCINTVGIVFSVLLIPVNPVVGVGLLLINSGLLMYNAYQASQ